MTDRLVPESADHPEQESSSPEENYIRQDLAMDIQAAMMTIPERQRSAIIMCHYQGLSNRDAAGVLGVSVDALESLMARGRRKLRQNLSTNWQEL
jgi:RNA polymerase sigma-70 factor (ECF subfamily)